MSIRDEYNKKFNISASNMWDTLKNFWIKYESKIMLCVSLILVAVISFEFGYLQGKDHKTDVMVIQKPAQEPKTGPEGTNSATINSGGSTAEKSLENAALTSQANCAFVGSKNSNKFYPPSCSYAKRIKPENVVCFANSQEAISQGRTESTGCTK